MSVISVVTPVHQASVPYLRETHNSLRDQTLPSGWSWEWLVQKDGEDVDLLDSLPDDSRIKVSSNRRSGPHVSRTMAYGRSVGELIKVLDADDILTPGALSRDIAALSDPTYGWSASAVLDLMPDGSLAGMDFPNPAEGELPLGSMLAYWRQYRRPKIHPASLCIRRDLLALLGGWMAIPSSEDTGLLMGLDAVRPGYFIATVGMHYRKHPDQITNHPAHASGPEWEARMRIIEDRALAMANYSPCISA